MYVYKKEIIPYPEESRVKVLAFDQGGIYIGVDYNATIKAFEKLGAINAQELYSQTNQTTLIDEFERGNVSTAEFFKYLRQNLHGLRKNVTDSELASAWNAMLVGIIPGILEFICELRKHRYITIVVSNADIIHQAGVIGQMEEAKAMKLFTSEAFDERFISYLFRFNKPSIDIFVEVTKALQKRFPEKNIKPNEILFIDDSKKHIIGRHESEGAINVGWQGLLVPSNLPVERFSQAVVDHLKALSKKQGPIKGKL
ncbi:MAG: hypothetical protein M1561_04025 [Gammaproteobacteria bacterium]|nr:hypothetical protein [Gammaproteobacteria bacterium]